MLSQERAKLKSLAQNINKDYQIGKDGITDAIINTLDLALEKNELIKVRLLDNSYTSAAEASEFLSTTLKAEVVIVIGKKVVLYRQSNKKGVKHLL